MLLKDYLVNMVSFQVPDATISCILELRGATVSTVFSSSDLKTAELSLADVLMYGATLPSSKSGVKDSDGGWSHSEGAISISASDKAGFRKRAFSIYAKYGETVADNSGITLCNLNGVPYRRC